VGFEPTPACDRFALAGRRLEPLGHPSSAPRTGFEPAISALTGRHPHPLDRRDLRTRRGIRTPNLRCLRALPLPFELPGLELLRGPKGSRTLHARFARRRCAPALRPWIVSAGSGGFEPPRVGSEPTMLPGCISSHWWSGPPLMSAGPSSGYRESNSDVRRGGARHCRCATAASHIKVLRRPCGIRTRGLQVEGLARSPLLQRSMSLIVRGPRVERGGSCSQGRWVDRLPHPGCVPSLEINGTLLLSTVEFSMFGRDRSRRRGGRTRTHYLRCWRPACKDRVHLTPMRKCSS
jgi:hypothetical protein